MAKKKVSGLHHDHRESNPALHHLYTGWAVRHLVKIDTAIALLSDESNLNLSPSISALFKEREVLTSENPAYKDAQEILNSIHGMTVHNFGYKEKKEFHLKGEE